MHERLTRLVQLNEARFNLADCALVLELPQSPLLLHCNPLVIDHVVGNLLDNALHFASQRKDGGRVTIRVRLEPDHDTERPLLIEIEDNGCGVKTGMMQTLFEPRYSDKAEGTGMGLFIAQSYTEGLGGTLGLVESVRWRCTRFVVRLPILLNQWRKE